MNKEDVFYLYNGILDGGDKYMCVLGHVQLFATLFVAHQAPPSMGFSWQESWRGLPFSQPRDQTMSFALQAESLLLSHEGRPHNGILLSHTKE